MAERSRSLRELLATLDLEDVTIADWCPTPDGTGPAVQVHLIVKVSGGLEFILRFQTAAGLDRFIADLQKHRRSVWGEPGPPSPIGGLFA